MKTLLLLPLVVLAGRSTTTAQENGLGPGNYQFTVAKSNYMPAASRITTQAGALPNPFIRLVRYGVIAGAFLPW